MLEKKNMCVEGQKNLYCSKRITSILFLFLYFSSLGLFQARSLLSSLKHFSTHNIHWIRWSALLRQEQKRSFCRFLSFVCHIRDFIQLLTALAQNDDLIRLRRIRLDISFTIAPINDASSWKDGWQRMYSNKPYILYKRYQNRAKILKVKDL